MNSGDLESCFSTIIPRVEFLNVQDQYSYNDDLICKYYLTDYEVQEGDRVAIFRLGWQYIKDYILFEWAPKDSEANLVVFNKPCLPKNTSEIYQFCFISGENNVLGASEPFQFSEKTKNYQSLFRSSVLKLDSSMQDDYKSLSNASPSSLNNIPDVIERDREMLRLREENEFLRNTLKILISKQNPKKYDSDIEDLKKLTADLQLTVVNQQNQLKDLQLHVAKCNSNYKSFRIEEDNLESACDNLKKRFDRTLNISTDDEFGELESLPPFPFAK
ncbi:hypothetical protein PPYR_13028 [Photinus pyralis]|uniref:SKICH domain-containing protein n=3 Tax=Photinus pyralis TaxID=7054 RepID=A0A1Y1NBS6_PHOPY|nr:calcium-binding and coiled-coil domain-containing protein 2-like [Photinus pyralis]KAB0793408.1 hypothetical protein PPYR_13028 [Photinus pyralis]